MSKTGIRLFGLIGYPLAHSFSANYFANKFAREKISGCIYENFPLTTVEEFEGLCRAKPELAGLNVTIPYKELILPYLEELEVSAAEIKAVNTIRFVHGKRTGFNTDVFGFMKSLQPLLQPGHAAALILGTGGSSKAVAFGLDKSGIEFEFVSRNPDGKELAYTDLTADVMRHYKIIVNTTPLGMVPETEQFPPIPYEWITPSHLCYDLIYNPAETLFLQKARSHGAAVKNGLEMLQLQAEKSWEIWNS